MKIDHSQLGYLYLGNQSGYDSGTLLYILYEKKMTCIVCFWIDSLITKLFLFWTHLLGAMGKCYGHHIWRRYLMHSFMIIYKCTDWVVDGLRQILSEICPFMLKLDTVNKGANTLETDMFRSLKLPMCSLYEKSVDRFSFSLLLDWLLITRLWWNAVHILWTIWNLKLVFDAQCFHLT